MNVEHLKLYEPYMMTEDEASLDQIFPSLNDLTPNTMDELKEDSILQKKVYVTRKGEIELWLVGLKGKKPNKARWMGNPRVGELYPYLSIFGTKCLLLREG